MSDERCETCRYKVDIQCRRYPPTLQGTIMGPHDKGAPNEGIWPVVGSYEWCGEYRPKGARSIDEYPADGH